MSLEDDAWVAVLTGGLMVSTLWLAISSWKAAKLASEATMTLTRAMEGLPFVAVANTAPDTKM